MPRAVALGGARMLGWVSLEVAGALFSVCVWEEPGELQMFLLFCLLYTPNLDKISLLFSEKKTTSSSVL